MEALEMNEVFLLDLSGNTKADKDAEVLSKGRDRYADEDDFTVADIW